MQNEILAAMKQICEEKNIPFESVVATVEAAMAVAYRKDFGEKNQNIQVTFDPATAGTRVFDVKKVVTDEFVAEAEREREEREKAREEEERLRAEGKPAPLVPPEDKSQTAEEPLAGGEPLPPPQAPPSVQGLAGGESVAPEEKKERYDPKSMIALSEAKKIKPDAEVGDEIRTELFPPAAYGRMAAQTAKQVIIQRLREAEREMVFREYKGKEGEIVNATVQRVEGRMVLFDLGHTTAIMPPSEQISREQYVPGTRLKVFILSVNASQKGPEVVISRAHPEMVRKLFSLEVPEVNSGSVEIRAVAREAGSRTKIAVLSHQKNIDPVGSCVGQRGTRVQTIISELGGEKIDIIEWSDDPVKFLSNALSPAKVISIKLDASTHTATAEVRDDQLSLAIGRAGQNVRLAAKLTGWKIDIVGEGGKRPSSLAAKQEALEKSAEVSVEGAPTTPHPSSDRRGEAAPEAAEQAETAPTTEGASAPAP